MLEAGQLDEKVVCGMDAIQLQETFDKAFPILITRLYGESTIHRSGDKTIGTLYERLTKAKGRKKRGGSEDLTLD